MNKVILFLFMMALIAHIIEEDIIKMRRARRRTKAKNLG